MRQRLRLGRNWQFASALERGDEYQRADARKSYRVIVDQHCRLYRLQNNLFHNASPHSIPLQLTFPTPKTLGPATPEEYAHGAVGTWGRHPELQLFADRVSVSMPTNIVLIPWRRAASFTFFSAAHERIVRKQRGNQNRPGYDVVPDSRIPEPPSGPHLMAQRFEACTGRIVGLITHLSADS